MAGAPMTVVETARFLKDARPLVSDPERAEIVAFIGANPEAGQVIPETGGVRKLQGEPYAGRTQRDEAARADAGGGLPAKRLGGFGWPQRPGRG